MDGTRQRLDAADVFAFSYRGYGYYRMGMIGRAAVDPIDLVRLGVQHLAEITISPRLREIVIRPGRVHIINIAQSDNLGICLLAYAAYLAMPDAAYADSRNLYCLTRPNASCPSENVAGDDSQSCKSGPGSVHEIAA